MPQTSPLLALFRPIGSSRFVSLHRLDAQGSFHYFNEVIDQKGRKRKGEDIFDVARYLKDA